MTEPVHKTTETPDPSIATGFVPGDAAAPGPDVASPDVASPDAASPDVASPAAVVAETDPQTVNPAELVTDSVAAVTAPEPAAPAEEAPAEASTADAPTDGPAPAEGGEAPDIDIIALARRAQELQAEWNAVGFAGREVEAELGPLFRRYLQIVFDRQRQQVGRKIEGRRALVTRAKELAARAEGADPGTLNALIREAKALQAEWKAGEPAPRGPENSAWQRFSGALSTIFTMRREMQDAAKGEREQIVAQVVQLAQGKDPFRAQRDLGALLTRWRKAAPVSGQAYGELKARLDAEVAKIRERADTERSRRDAEDKKAQAERAKWAARVVKEAQRSQPQRRRDDRPRPAAGGDAGNALAAALAAATTGRRDEVAADVARYEKTVQDLRARLEAVEQGAAPAHAETVDTEQGFTIVNAVDRGADNPVRIRAELERAEAALARRTAELAELDASTKGLGIATSS